MRAALEHDACRAAGGDQRRQQGLENQARAARRANRHVVLTRLHRPRLEVDRRRAERGAAHLGPTDTRRGLDRSQVLAHQTQNAAFNRSIAEIEQVAIASRAPILLMGPTGAGKSQLARRIYELKHMRRQITGPLVEINCATLRGSMAMSTLFGHIRGAFTGAAGERPGLLRAANGGVLFLDEIGELGLDEQAMLLRALEEKRFLPVGSDREVESDFQLIAGTNRTLPTAVRVGQFREDLLARINLWTFRLPGLAKRREDIEPNLDYELARWAGETGTQIRFNREARAALGQKARTLYRQISVLRRFPDVAHRPKNLNAG